MKDKVWAAAEKYLTAKGYDVWKVDADASILTAFDKELDEVAFISFCWRESNDEGFPEEKFTREQFEGYAIGNIPELTCIDYPFRFDSLALIVLPGNRGVLRHHIRCLDA